MPDETAHKKPSYLDLQCLPSSLQIFNIIQFELKVLSNFADVILWSVRVVSEAKKASLSPCRKETLKTGFPTIRLICTKGP